MKIWKYKLTRSTSQIIVMPKNSEILDIQTQDNDFVMWALVDTESKNIEVKINMYGTGWETNDNATKDEYIATVQDGEFVWHFFMNYGIN